MDWQTITTSDTHKTFLISIRDESNGSFFFNLTDFKELWREKIDWQAILRRTKSENTFMNVNGEESSIQQTLFSVANQYLCSATENELLLKTKYYKAGVPFHFHWKLTKSSVDEFYEEITKKLLVTVLNVQDQRNELIDIVKRKDAEISQYKIEGATLMRKHIATQPFLKPEFDGKFELMSDSALFIGNDNCNTIKSICSYNSLVKNVSANTLHVTEGPSPTKISKPYKNKEENAIRKFKTKKDCTIKYESSCELLPSDDSEEMELDLKSDKGRADVTNDVLTESKKEEPKGFPKRKLRSKLNL